MEQKHLRRHAKGYTRQTTRETPNRWYAWHSQCRTYSCTHYCHQKIKIDRELTGNGRTHYDAALSRPPETVEVCPATLLKPPEIVAYLRPRHTHAQTHAPHTCKRFCIHPYVQDVHINATAGGQQQVAARARHHTRAHISKSDPQVDERDECACGCVIATHVSVALLPEPPPTVA